MANYSKISLHCPFKFVPATASPGIHFDDAWACEQIKPWEKPAYYKQKWQTADTTKIQCISTVAPDDLKVYDVNQSVVKSIAWTAVLTTTTYAVYELTYDISNLPDGYYWNYQKFELLTYSAAFISECIHLKAAHKNTVLITYGHSFNDYDTIFTTGIQMSFRVEAAIMDMEPKAERTSYANQVRDIATLYGVPYRVFKFNIGEAAGVAPWVIDLINRIFVCSYISIEGRTYQADEGGKMEINRVKGYPLVGGSIEIVEAKNIYSIQKNDLTVLAPGIITAYNIETDFFGAATPVQITETEQL